MSMRSLPDFIGIGALKAGTTFLDSCLRGHPQLSLPRDLKEAEFFTRHYGRGPEWYAGLFDPPDGRLRGEISPQYVSDPDALERIHRANAEVRIIVALRDPAERVISQYRHWVQETGYRGDLDTFLDDHPGAVSRSHYATALQPWLEKFGHDALHVVIFEDLIDTTTATVRATLRFLDVTDDWSPAAGDQPSNASVAPRFPRVYAMAKRVSRQLQAGGHTHLVAALKQTPAAAMLKGGAPPKVEITAEARQRLAARFSADIDWVSKLTGLDMGNRWRS